MWAYVFIIILIILIAFAYAQTYFDKYLPSKWQKHIPYSNKPFPAPAKFTGRESMFTGESGKNPNIPTVVKLRSGRFINFGTMI